MAWKKVRLLSISGFQILLKTLKKRVEAHNFDIRKTLLEYDDISNEQRKLIYQQRDYILKNNAATLISTVCSNYTQDYIDVNKDQLLSHDVDLLKFNEIIKTDFLIDVEINKMIKDNQLSISTLKDIMEEQLLRKIENNIDTIPNNERNELIKNISLAVIDEEYRNHLSAMDYLRQSIGLRGYAQKNPKNEYKRESFEMFNIMLMDITKEILKICCRIKIENYNTTPEVKSPDDGIVKKTDDPGCLLNTTNGEVPRNKRCPVTNLKFKQCCGKLT